MEICTDLVGVKKNRAAQRRELRRGVVRRDGINLSAVKSGASRSLAAGCESPGLPLTQRSAARWMEARRLGCGGVCVGRGLWREEEAALQWSKSQNHKKKIGSLIGETGNQGFYGD